MEEGIYIFKDSNSFLKVMEQLAKEYGKPKPLIELNKHLNTSTEANKEINYLNKCSINCFTGFQKHSLIKLSVTGSDGVKYHITYSFNTGLGNGLYRKLHRYLRKREQGAF